MPPYIPDCEEGEDLEHFINRVIEPLSADYEREAKYVVHELVKYIHQLPDYSISEVVKGGSLGKDTFIPKMADIDLIIFFNGYNTVKELVQDKLNILKDIKRYFRPRRKHNWIQDIECLRSDEYLVTFKIKLRAVKNWFKVDMLPAIDIVQKYGINTDEDLVSIYELMQAEKELVRSHYSVCFAKVQKGLFKDQTTPVIHLIQLLKYCNKKLDLGITSYCCEVLVLFVFSQYYRNGNFNLNKAFRTVLDLLKRYETLHIVASDYDDEYEWQHHEKPYILDPVNPFSNTLRPLPREKINQLTTWAKNTLQCYHKTYLPLMHHNNNNDFCTPARNHTPRKKLVRRAKNTLQLYHKTYLPTMSDVPLKCHNNNNDVAITIDSYTPTTGHTCNTSKESYKCCYVVIIIVIVILILFAYFILRKYN